MNLLALDTSTDHAAIGLATARGVFTVPPTNPGRRHGRDLIAQIEILLGQALLRPRELNVIAAGFGPGSYTGLRVGLMAAKTLAYATGAALVGLDSLEAVARNAPDDELRIAVVADAQRGDVYAADFERRTPGSPLTLVRDCRIEALADWTARLAPGTRVLGPGLTAPHIRAAVRLELVVGDEILNYPDANRLLELATDGWLSGRRDNLWLLEPHYLRRSAAEEQWDARERLIEGGK
jgi:tRNA threonylcarbamoyladenosine biosynthesis protein TsaB